MPPSGFNEYSKILSQERQKAVFGFLFDPGWIWRRKSIRLAPWSPERQPFSFLLAVHFHVSRRLLLSRQLLLSQHVFVLQVFGMQQMPNGFLFNYLNIKR